MKRILAVLVSLCFVLPLFIEARVVTETEAYTVAEKMISLENQMVHLRLSKEPVFFKSLEPLLYKDEVIGYLVNLEPRGFMILAAMTENAPQKFVSFSKNFDEVKDSPFLAYAMDQLLYDKVHLNYCMNQALVQEYCRFPEAADLNKIYKNESKWISMLSSEQVARDSSLGYQTPLLINEVYPLMMFVNLKQGDPWNLSTPMLSGKHTLAGCAAVAMTSIMVGYWRYPYRGEGSNSYPWHGTTLYANFDKQYQPFTDTICNGVNHTPTCFHTELSKLLADVGISINTAYGYDPDSNTYSPTNGSGAILNDNKSLQTFFKYSPGIKTVLRTDYSSWNDWFNLLTNDLNSSHPNYRDEPYPYDRGWPVLLAAIKPGEKTGHSVVIDGYRTVPSNQVHVKLGWGGLSDNYYSMDNIYGYGDATRDFAVIGIRPRSQIPTVEIISPINGEAVHGDNVYIHLKASDDYHTIEYVEYYVDGKLIEKFHIMDFSAQHFHINWDSTQVKNGQHSIKAIVYDEEGQASLPSQISVNVCNATVNLSATRKTESAWLVKKQYADLSFTVTDSCDYHVWWYRLFRKEADGAYSEIYTWNRYDLGELPLSEDYADKYLEKDKTYTYILKAYDKSEVLCGKSAEITI